MITFRFGDLESKSLELTRVRFEKIALFLEQNLRLNGRMIVLNQVLCHPKFFQLICINCNYMRNLALYFHNCWIFFFAQFSFHCFSKLPKSQFEFVGLSKRSRIRQQMIIGHSDLIFFQGQDKKSPVIKLIHSKYVIKEFRA